MIQSNFQKAFGVEVFHSYFDKGICRDLLFKPGADTAVLFQKIGAKMRNKANGFDLYLNGPVSTVLPYLKKTASQPYFDFQIVSIREAFYLYTNLPLKSVGVWLYNSQNTGKGTNDLGGTLQEGVGAATFGRLRICFEDILQAQTASSAQTEPSAQAASPAPIFSIRYQARSTQWQYFVVNRNAIPLSSPSIVSKSPITFSAPLPVTIGNGEPALFFSTGSQRIALSEIPNAGFDLVSQSKVIRKSLPNPDPWSIGIVDDLVYSPMYVYL